MTPFLYFLAAAGVLAALFGLCAYGMTWRENRKRRRKEERIAALRRTLTPYDFYRTVPSAVNQSFSFGPMQAGDRVRIRRAFTDYNGHCYAAGEEFFFACTYFLPYDDGYTLFISYDGREISCICLQLRSEAQWDICVAAEKYFEVVLPRL